MRRTRGSALVGTLCVLAALALGAGCASEGVVDGASPADADAPADDGGATSGGSSGDDPADDPGGATFGDAPASGGGVVPLPGFRPVLTVVTPSASDGACGRDQLGGLDGQCYELGRDGPGLDAVAAARSALPGGDPSGAPVVEVELTAAGLDEFNALAAECYELTATCPTGQVAIVADDVVVSAPSIVVREFDADDILISGDFDTDDTETIADALAR